MHTQQNNTADQAGRSLRIAVIEDNEDGRASLVQVLEFLGHEVQAAADGLEGEQLVRRMQPDVVLLDLGLPGIDGLEVCRRVRADPATAATPVLALSGWGTEDDLRRTRQAGFNLHLVKPVDVQSLLGHLAHLDTFRDRMA